MGEDEGEEKQKRTVVVRAQDGDWVMGDDIILHVTGDETIIEIQEVISNRRQSDTYVKTTL